MEKDIDKIKQEINNMAIKYNLRFIIFKTTDTSLTEGQIVGTKVETELIY